MPINPDGGLVELITTLQVGNQNAARLTTALSDVLAAQSAQNSAFAIYYSSIPSSSGAVFIASSVTYLTMVSVTTSAAGTATGKLYDCGSVANVSSANLFAVIPSDGQLILNWPIRFGLVVQPSSTNNQTVAVSYI